MDNPPAGAIMPRSPLQGERERTGRMRRFLIFGLLGPPIGFIVGMFVLLPLLNGEFKFEPGNLVLLPLAYALGFIPAILAAIFDDVLANRGVRYRPAWTALAAFVVSFFPLATAIAMGFLRSPWILVFGTLGTVPGFLCSWLSRSSRTVTVSKDS